MTMTTSLITKHFNRIASRSGKSSRLVYSPACESVLSLTLDMVPTSINIGSIFALMTMLPMMMTMIITILTMAGLLPNITVRYSQSWVLELLRMSPL